MKFFIKIFGCQYNEWDGARLDYLLQKNGLTLSDEKNADIIFAIACSVRKSAVDRLLGKVKNWREEDKKVVISGCMLPKDKKKIAARGAVFCDVSDFDSLKETIINCHSDPLALSKDGGIFVKDPSTSLGMTELLKTDVLPSHYLPIMLGCNNFCSYCVVPYTKGRERSRDFDKIVEEFKKLVEAGHKEITLLGQNVNSYEHDFARLLKILNDVPGDFQISFTSNHPKDMNDEIIEAIANLPKVKKEIHLPLQSGSNKILKAMNRPYTKEKYLKLIEKLKKAVHNIRISTDIIVGFPGETEKDFLETKDLIKKVGFYWIFANKYSPREGTASFKLGDPIPWPEKQRRWREIDNLVNKK